MIRIASQPKPATPEWHEVFLRLLPAIRQHARISFRHLDPESREECVQNCIANAMVAYLRLYELGKVDLAYHQNHNRFPHFGRIVGGVTTLIARACQHTPLWGWAATRP